MKFEVDKFQADIDKLFKYSVDHLLPGNREKAELSSEEVRRLIGVSSILSLSDVPDELALAYEVISRLVECGSNEKSQIVQAADIIFSRIGNFPGRTLLRGRYRELEKFSPSLMLSLERIAREVENTVVDEVMLTDFQHKLYTSLENQRSVSVSAPTSAGKSFILNLDLVRRLRCGAEENIVYIVPTRALISEVSSRIRHTIKSKEIQGVLVRTAPFPLKESRNVKNIIYVLTPERLLSLLKPENNKKRITSIFIDEAHEIQKGNRGITLQSAVDLALGKHPLASIMFASPLISNPGYFLSLFGRQDEGLFFTETVSPVSQNLLLISEVVRQRGMINVSLLAGDRSVDLGNSSVGFDFRGSKTKQRACFANEITGSDESTIIFADGPGEAEKVAEELMEVSKDFLISEDVRDFINFIRTEVHEEYPLAVSLASGVAFHYGVMPSIVRSGVEDLFKAGEIRFLCCTSTLLQGVNLPAKHIVIENPHSGTKPMSRSDFLNLSGRAGRLLQEFHGNIWCIRPSDWEEESYKGDNLQQVRASMEKLMDDGGSIIQSLMSGEIEADKKDFAEAGFSRLYREIIENDESEVIKKYQTIENSEMLAQNLKHVQNLKLTLPQEILESHSSLRPDHLQMLHDKLYGAVYTEEFTLLNPYSVGGYRRMERAIEIISDVFQWAESQKFRSWVCNLSHQWATGTAINVLIRDRVNYIRRQDNSSTKTSTIIRQLLGIIETDIRFKLVKYFSAYEDIIRYCLKMKGGTDDEIKQAAYHTFLEFGACSPIELSLMSLGFSRFTALRLGKMLDWGDSVEVEDYASVIANSNIDSLKIPRVCIKEIKEIIGKQ
jgi:superfamily II DNA/RNA helicase